MYRSSRWISAARAALGALAVLFALTLVSNEAKAACYVAFVHGHRDTPPSGNPEAYWNPSVTASTPIGGEPTGYSFDYWASRTNGCKTKLVTWNSTWSFKNRAYEVATSLKAFIDAESIPNGQLIIVAHSMGGLVTRYILNNAYPGSPGYYNSTWTSVADKTKYIVTSQTPHTGSQGADALAGESASAYVNFWGSFALFFGMTSRDAGTDSMRRIEMEYASVSGGWMADSLRTKKIYTIESYRTGTAAGPASGVGAAHTDNLEKAWGALCYKPILLNSYLCPSVEGDGLVERLSARGVLQRSGRWDHSRQYGSLYPTNYSTDPNSNVCNTANSACKKWTSGSYIPGGRVRWLRYGGDHQQGAWDYWSTTLQDYVKGTTTTSYLASYIGKNVLTLAP